MNVKTLDLIPYTLNIFLWHPTQVAAIDNNTNDIRSKLRAEAELCWNSGKCYREFRTMHFCETQEPAEFIYTFVADHDNKAIYISGTKVHLD